MYTNAVLFTIFFDFSPKTWKCYFSRVPTNFRFGKKIPCEWLYCFIFSSNSFRLPFIYFNFRGILFYFLTVYQFFLLISFVCDDIMCQLCIKFIHNTYFKGARIKNKSKLNIKKVYEHKKTCRFCKKNCIY